MKYFITTVLYNDYKVNKLLYKYLIQEDNGVSLVLYAD